MSFDEITFKEIYEDLNCTNSKENKLKEAENLIKKGVLLGQSSLALNHSNQTTHQIHQTNLRNYRQFIEHNLNNYLTDVLKILPEEEYPKDLQLNLSSDEFKDFLNLPCHGQFLDCDNNKISDEDVAALFENIEVPSVQNIQCLKRSFLNDIAPPSENSVKKFAISNPIVSKPPTMQFNPPRENHDWHFDFSNLKENQNRTDARDIGKTFQKNSVDLNIEREHSTGFSNQNAHPQNSKQWRNDRPLFSFDIIKKPTVSNVNIPSSNNNLNSFITAKEEMIRQNLIKNGQKPNPPSYIPLSSYGTKAKTLGLRRSLNSPFVPPVSMEVEPENEIDDKLKHIEPKMIELIRNEIMVHSSPVDWDDIAGLEYAKATIQEAVIWPLLRPDIFTGLRGPPRGILLFGPPGTGKTLIGRCIAAKSKSTFFSISASSLTSKWIGEGEKMVRALFTVASVHQPAVIFIDEIDSLLSQRSDTEHESSRRLKTEFLVQLDGARTSEDERILIVGATNRPQELDEAARRRLTKRLYIPLPESAARVQMLKSLLKKERNQISVEEITEIGRLTDGFSGADMKSLCHEALMGPIRSIGLDEMELIDINDVRPVNFLDFTNALKRVRASVSKDDLIHYEKWDSTYGLSSLK